MGTGQGRGVSRGSIVAVALATSALVVALAPPARAQDVPTDDATEGTPTPTTVNADFHTLETPPLAEGQFELITLSTMPDTVTGGDVLIAVRGLPADAALTLTAGDRDVTETLSPVDGVDERRGLITGLPQGTTTLTATSGSAVATLDVINHPITGPVLSGPHQEPFRCRTEEAGLGAPLDEDCSAEPRYDWYYRSALDQAFHRLADPSSYPDDVAVTETDTGEVVPFVVRVDSRTINRGIARIAVLDDPASRGPNESFDASLWNHRVYHAFGESCGVGYQQGVNTPETVLGGLDLTNISPDNLLINLVGITERLGAGDVIVHSTLTSFGVHCNPFISVETLMMIKEYLIETYGTVDAIIGTNGSGAALQQYNAANNAPGLISAAMPTATFADIVTTAMTVVDCGLMNHYRENTPLKWTNLEWAAVTGHHPLTALDINDICISWGDTFLPRLDPTDGCVDEEILYDPVTNPTGVRCTIQDGLVNLFGTDENGFARRPIDNTGVQYGYEAYRNGDIGLAKFLDLNERIGGYDIDGNPIPERMSMSSELASLIYRVGGVIGRGALDETPVLDIAPYLDLIPVANIHESVRPFVIRDRLRTQSGTDQTQVIWRGVLTQADAYDTMEAWQTAVDASRPGPGGDHTAAVIDARPASLGDRCSFGTVGGRLDLPASITAPLNLVELPLLPGLSELGIDLDIPVRIDIPEDFDSGLGVCSIALPVGRTPRMVAGMPLSDDVIKCQLKEVVADDYPGASAAALDRLRAVFPDGVCDYSLPAAEDVEESMVWVSLGGEVLEEPHELTWRVGRSVVMAAAADPVALDPVALDGAPPPTRGIPATGVPATLILGAGAALAVMALRVRRRIS